MEAFSNLIVSIELFNFFNFSVFSIHFMMQCIYDTTMEMNKKILENYFSQSFQRKKIRMWYYSQITRSTNKQIICFHIIFGMDSPFLQMLSLMRKTKTQRDFISMLPYSQRGIPKIEVHPLQMAFPCPRECVLLRVQEELCQSYTHLTQLSIVLLKHT